VWTKREALVKFFNEDGKFLYEAAKFEDIYSIYKISSDGSSKITVAASLALFKVQEMLVCYLWNLKVRSDLQGKGLGKRLTNDIVTCVENEYEQNYNAALIIVGMSQVTKPHEFFTKQGF
jgi:ribosomal protein S18 acetylase RimI-like enzyme